MSTVNKKTKDLLILALASLLSFSVLGIFLAGFLKLNSSVASSKSSRKGLQVSSLTIGVLSQPTAYDSLANYLRTQFGNKVQVTIDGEQSLSYKDAQNRLKRKEWDITFTLSPMLSVAAKENGYTFAAQMFPEQPPYYEAVLFVKSDSAIQSIKDLNRTKTIALGGFNSASSFYMPVYDLFGETLRVDVGNRSQKIIEMVKNGQADVGAAASIAVKGDATLRIIHQSRAIPGGNVYLSPNLSESDRELIKTALLNAPINIQKQANYGSGIEQNYFQFLKISQRAEEVLKCADFQHNPVNFFCSSSNLPPSSQTVLPQKE